MTELPRWRKSPLSADQGNCVELAEVADGISLRNSTAPDAGTLRLTRIAAAGFIAAWRAGDFDDLA
jgi:hypothetical protein